MSLCFAARCLPKFAALRCAVLCCAVLCCAVLCCAVLCLSEARAHMQTEKQRLIWAYKILFLDVLFPLNVRKVIFCDSDQVVRGDMAELWNMDLHVSILPLCPHPKPPKLLEQIPMVLNTCHINLYNTKPWLTHTQMHACKRCQ